MHKFLRAALLALSLITTSSIVVTAPANATGLFDIVTKGSTSRSVTVDIIDSTDGTPETGVVFNTSGIDLWYRREGAALTAITEVTLAALTTAYTSGGFLAVANGTYRLDLPDAAFATGANYVDFGGTVTGMIVIGGRVRLVDYSLEDAVRGTVGTALPNAVAGASGGALISGTNAGTTTLGALTVSGATTLTGNVSMAAGLNITQSSANTAALVVTGNGTGNGATFTSGSGATGNGISAVAASTNGNGVNAAGTGTGSGAIATGGATGHGFNGVGGSTSGSGWRAAGTAGNSPAATLVGQGSAAGLLATGGATGAGASFVGGATSGPGFSATGTAGNSSAMSLAGQGSGHGFIATGGATGHGMRLVGGATSGNGISTSFTAPSAGAPELGFGVTGTLSGTHSTTTADLGTNAPGTVSDIVGHTLTFPTRNASRTVSAYDTSTGIATWTTALDSDITLTNADPWILYETSPGASGGSDILTIEGQDATTYLDSLDNPTLAILGTPIDLGIGGATIADNLQEIEGQTDDIGAAGAGLTAADDAVMTRLGAPAGASVSADVAAVKADSAAIKTKTDFLPSATAGAAGGVFIAGTNAATTVTTAFTTTFTGNLTGSAASVTGAVGSVTGNIGGNVTGSVASVTGNVGGNVIGFVGSVNTGGVSAASLSPDAGTELAAAMWANATRELTSGLNIVLAKGTGLTGLNDLSAAQVNAEVDTGLSDIHLNYLFAADYDPASKPGLAGGLLNEIVENDAGASRFTTEVLENGPAGGGGGSSDWSVGEREQIRHRLGIDGTAQAPTATPSLASAAMISALNNLSATQLRDLVIEDQGGGVTLGCAISIVLAYAAGDIVTIGTSSTYEETSGTETRISGTVPSAGNRTAAITCPTY